MKKMPRKIPFGALAAAACLGGELALLADIALVLSGHTTPLPVFAGIWLLVFLGVLRIWAGKPRRLWCFVLGVPAALAVLAAVCAAGWQSFRQDAAYCAPDEGKAGIYGDRRVMLIVPHQDDDINILGGVLEEYARYGSELYPVFVTNGDYAGLTQTRYGEALCVFAGMGVPEENVIFLGYGDGWQEGGPHLYNAPSGQVLTSRHGRTQTYGTADHAPYREGRDYTIDNLREDLKSVILEYRPDVLFCSDYDHHIDHKAVTLLFDQVVGQLLKEVPDYRPIVYKAYAYGTAWEAEPDYYVENLGSTKNLFAQPYGQQPGVYHWEARIRFPVAGGTLSRSLLGSGAYETLAQYHSQGAQYHAAAVINADKVAWQRRTDSLCLGAQITVSSGKAGLLNDFMLTDNLDLGDPERMPWDGVWIPEPEDAQQQVTVSLPEDTAVDTVVLYDHPSPEHNILDARITFADGTQVQTGPLDPGGAATVIPAAGRGSFAVSLLRREGDMAGLTEVEAFGESSQQDGAFVKLMDAEENFLYDYRTAPEGTGHLQLYTWGGLPELGSGAYEVRVDNPACTAAVEGDRIRFSCPAGQTGGITVTLGQTGIGDSITIRNPGALSRLWGDLWQRGEAFFYEAWCRGAQEMLVPARILEKVSYVLRHGL